MCGQAKANIDFRGQKSRAELKKERAGNVDPQAVLLLTTPHDAIAQIMLLSRGPHRLHTSLDS